MVFLAALEDIMAETIPGKVPRVVSLNTKKRKKRKRKKKRRMRSFRKSAESMFLQRLTLPNANPRSYVLLGKC